MDELHLLCDCHVDCVTFIVYEDPEDSYVVFSNWWQQNQPWKQRIKAAWAILRGKEYYFSEVFLRPEQVEQIKEYLNERTSPKQ